MVRYPSLIALFVAQAGCGGTTGIVGDGRIDPGDDDPLVDVVVDSHDDPVADPPADTMLDPEPDLPMGPGITFRISFLTDIPGWEYLYIQASDEMGHQTWARITTPDGSVPMQLRCDVCPCDVCFGCPICGPAMPIALRIDTGESADWTWNGITKPMTTCQPDPTFPPMTCQDSGTLPPGMYGASFCFRVGGADDYADGWIPDPVCVDLEFEYPVPGGVLHYEVNNSG